MRTFFLSLLGLIVAIGAAAAFMTAMPGTSHDGALPPLLAEESARKERLAGITRQLASVIGERNMNHPEALQRAALFVESELAATGLALERQEYKVGEHTVRNIEVELPGTTRPQERVVVAANYDSLIDSPGADTNASGMAALIVLASELAATRASLPLARAVRFVALVNKEPPHFQTETMGSVRYTRRANERREAITAMLNLQSLGVYSDAPGSQLYPLPLSSVFPGTGNFIAFVGNLSSRGLVRRAVASFRGAAAFPSIGAALPGAAPGVGWSDHWSFWQAGYEAIMVTDTAMFRGSIFGTKDDTPEHLDFERLARVVTGLKGVVRDLATTSD